MQVALERRDRGEHDDGEKWHQHADAGGQQHMVERSTALSDELPALRVPEVGRQSAHALQGSGSIFPARCENRRKACNRRDFQILRVAHQARLEWR